MNAIFGNWVAVAGGMLAVGLLSRLLSSWAQAIYEIWRSSPTKRPWGSLVGVSLLHAGPWGLVAVVALCIYIGALPWAPWFFGGVVVQLLFLGAAMWVVLRNRRRQSKDGNAA